MVSSVFWDSTYKMINSTRFPKLIFSNAPTVSPASLAILSVASVNSADSGTIAMAFVMKTMAGYVCAMYAAAPSGTNTMRQVSHVDESTNSRRLDVKVTLLVPAAAPSIIICRSFCVEEKSLLSLSMLVRGIDCRELLLETCL